jgi:tetratricopeptide (TPR) repeat protein
MKKLLVILFSVAFLSASSQSPFARVRQLYEENNVPKGFTVLDSCQKAGINIDSVYYYKGLGNLRLEKMKAARQFCDLLERDFPSFYFRHYLKGLIYFVDLDYGKSIDELNKVLAADTNNLKALYNRSLAFGMLEDYKTAREDLSKCINMHPNYSQAYYSRAYWAELNAMYPEAVADYEKTISLNPKNYDAYIGLAHVYQLQKNNDKACEALARAITAGSQVAEEVKDNYCK